MASVAQAAGSPVARVSTVSSSNAPSPSETLPQWPAGCSLSSALAVPSCCRWDRAVAEMTGYCAYEEIGSGAPILGALGAGSNTSGCLLKAKGVAGPRLVAEATVFVVSGLEIGDCGLEKASCSILVPHADRMPEEILFWPFAHKKTGLSCPFSYSPQQKRFWGRL